MNTNNQIMMDLETLSTEPHAVILTIGALWFDPFSDAEPGPGFHIRVEIDSQERHVDENTLIWWGQQDPEVQAEAFHDENRHPMTDALREFVKFSEGADGYWSHGTVFDVGILENSFIEQGMRSWIPWKYHQVRDCRTVLKISDTVVDSHSGGAHNALIDCYNQALAVQQATLKMNLHRLPTE
jgi:hypothetical protein